MRDRNKIEVLLFFMAFIALSLVITLNLSYLQSFSQKGINVYGYPAVFVLSFLSDTTDQPIEPDTIGGFAVVVGLNVFIVFLLAVAGEWSINLLSFYLSKKYFSKKIIDSCSTKEYRNYCKWFVKYGRLSLLFSALIFPYIIFIWLSGAFQMKFRDFFIFGMLPRVLRIGVILLVVAGILSVL